MKYSFQYKGKEVEIDGDDDLVSTIRELFEDHTATSTQLQNQPSLKEQLALWEKAKPIFAALGKEVDFDLPSTEVMKICLGDKYNTENVSDETVKYLFDNVLTVEAAPAPVENPAKKPANTPKEKIKPTPITGTTKGISSQELEEIMSKNRLSGSVTPTA
jgi:hypothetical protein